MTDFPSLPAEGETTRQVDVTVSYATDPDKLFKAHGIPIDEPRAAAAVTAELYSASGFSTINKNADMLVIQRNLTKPMVYARCDS